MPLTRALTIAVQAVRPERGLCNPRMLQIFRPIPIFLSRSSPSDCVHHGRRQIGRILF